MNRNLWKRAGLRGLMGMPIGVTISLAITIVISLIIGKGDYVPVVPQLIQECGSEISAVIAQTVCSLLYGAVYAGASVVWETDWSLLKMTAVHFAVCSLGALPIAYAMWWMDHSVKGALIYFGIFLLIYAVIWLSMRAKMKEKVDAMNKKISQMH